MIYFTSDLHFGHENVIRFDRRPFASAEEMDRVLIGRWNNKVSDADTVYVLGDLSWHNDQKTCEILSQLQGKKILIQGNHDRIHGQVRHFFEEVCPYKEVTLPGNISVVLCHYPILFFNRHYYGAYMLYGHVHNSKEWEITEQHKTELQQQGVKCNLFNVGCMVRNYEPVTLDEIIQQEERINNYVRK